MKDPVRYGLAIISHGLDERRKLQKAGKIPLDKGLNLRPSNPLVVRPNATKDDLMTALPVVCESHDISESDLDTLKWTLKQRRKQREKDKIMHQAEAEKSWSAQAMPLYRFGLMLSYAETSSTHKAIKQEIADLPTSTKRKLLKDLLDGQRTTSFTAVSLQTIQEGTHWLASILAAEK